MLFQPADYQGEELGLTVSQMTPWGFSGSQLRVSCESPTVRIQTVQYQNQVMEKKYKNTICKIRTEHNPISDHDALTSRRLGKSQLL